MRISLLSGLTAILAGSLLLSCGDTPSALRGKDAMVPQVGAPLASATATTALPDVRFSEIHYDNAGTDSGEAIEISGPAGTTLSGWSIVPYNGNGGGKYSETALSGTIPATCGSRGVVVTPVNGLQNGPSSGAPYGDGVALVNATGAVVEFLSWEGTFTATDGPARGLTSTDIGALEDGTGPTTGSIQRAASGVWTTGNTNTFGACNDNGPPPAEVARVQVSPATTAVAQGGTATFSATAFDATDAVVPGAVFTWSAAPTTIATVSAAGVATGVSAGDAVITARAANGVTGTAALTVTAAPPPVTGVKISEIHYDNNSTDVGEAVEVQGPAGADLSGWTVVLYNGNGGASYATITLTGTLPASCGTTGVMTVPAVGIQNGSPDGVALVDRSGRLVEFLSYEGTFTATNGAATGVVSTDIGVSEPDNEPLGLSLQRDDAGWYGPVPASFGLCNPPAPPPPPPAPTVSINGRVPSDPALPVGFEDQLFATQHDGSGNTVPTTFTWSSETPAIASIDGTGVMHVLAAGRATFRATAADGTTATWTLPTAVATLGTTAQYGNNTEFGEPFDADASDDFIIRRLEYTTSYSPRRNTPNWVAYDLDGSQIGSEDRCNCFTQDPELPASFAHLTTNSYTGAGAAAGYGIDRGHLARSYDRTTGTLDNATTYYLSNIIPQAGDLNQGPWATMENYLGDLATAQNKEVYIVAGVAGSKGTVKDSGTIVIPAQVWKVAVIMPRDKGLADVHGLADLQVIAVIMPNDPGVRNVDWHSYQTTVDAVEALSGYDLLSALPEPLQAIVESNDHYPTANAGGLYSGAEGSALGFSGAVSSDPDPGDVLTYAWSFGDGETGTGAAPSHSYGDNGSYTVTLVVTDRFGAADTATTTVQVSNVAPTVGALPDTTLLPGESYAAVGSFADPGTDTWSATVSWGDGSTTSMALPGKTFSLAHTYASAGSYAPAVTVSDDDGGTGSGAGNVTVLSQSQGLLVLAGMVDALAAAGKLNNGGNTSLHAHLDAAAKQIGMGHLSVAAAQLSGFKSELAGRVQSGQLAAADGDPLLRYVQRLIDSLS